MYSTTSEHNGVPQRPPASAHLMVSSTDRYTTFFDQIGNPTTSAKWRLNKNQNILTGYFTRLAITQIQFQWNIPTICLGVNDIFAITIEGVDFNVIIPTGFYTPATLAEAIEAQVKLEPSYVSAWNFNVSGFDTGFVFTVSAPYEFSITLAPDTEDPDFIRNNRFLITIGAWEGTFDENVDTAYTGVPTMLATRWVDICSSGLTQFQKVKDATSMPQNLTSDVIARVYATAPNTSINDAMPGQILNSPNILCIDYNTPKHIRWSPDQAVANFDIQVYDEFGQPMYWSETYKTEYQFTILASET